MLFRSRGESCAHGAVAREHACRAEEAGDAAAAQDSAHGERVVEGFSPGRERHVDVRLLKHCGSCRRAFVSASFGFTYLALSIGTSSRGSSVEYGLPLTVGGVGRRLSELAD